MNTLRNLIDLIFNRRNIVTGSLPYKTAFVSYAQKRTTLWLICVWKEPI